MCYVGKYSVPHIWGNKRHRYEREERKLKEKNKAKNILKEYATITVGMFIVSAAVYYLMMPNSFVVGSISGLVMVLANFIPLKVSTMTMILNVALLIIWDCVCRKRILEVRRSLHL